ncbi:MAG TPA: diguanylate cyclase [Planctomycetaceae bacterium]|nr:diguanylate cyclase [Planctomycetaceae bacterium]
MPRRPFPVPDVDELEIHRKLSMFGLTEIDVHRLSMARPTIRLHTDEIINSFYAHVSEYPELVQFIPDLNTLRGLRIAMKHYVDGFGENFETPEYFARQRRVGMVHEKIGIRPGWYMAAFTYLGMTIKSFVTREFTGSPAELAEMLESIQKICQLDATLAIETYHLSAMERIEGLMTQLERDQDEIRRIAQTDPLTGLLNRRYFLEKLEAEFHRCKNFGRPLCVMLLDLDNFKSINDRYGHPVGDDVLQATGQVLRENVRGTDWCGRIGGEELAIVLPECNLATANLIGDRIRLAIRALEFGEESTRFSPSVSIGLCGITYDFHESAAMLKLADDALYRAKKDGKNRVCVGGQPMTVVAGM